MKYIRSINNNPFSITRTTIVAQITPPGVGAVHIIRLSGIICGDIACDMLKGFCIQSGNERVMQLATVVKCGVQDTVLATYFMAPNSYTGEDVVEISLHGNQTLADTLIKECVRRGACLAEPGEFSCRAFLNGKIDLTQAEGICDLINAQTQSQINAAHELSGGELSKILLKAYNRLVNMAAEATVAIDYPEEEIDLNISNEIERRLIALKRKLSFVINTFESGRLIREGVRIAIVGRPNVGKSSILNTILGCERAIVTDIAGTTRDVLQESYNYNNLKFVFSDTAGIRKSDDKIEVMGIARSYEAIRQADVVLFVTDMLNDPIEPEIMERAKNKQVIKIINKNDINNLYQDGYLSMSAKNELYSEVLKEDIHRLIKNKVSGEGVRLTTLRQKQALQKCNGLVTEAIDACKNQPLDIVASVITEAAACIGALCGMTASESVIAEIFSKFCVGK